MTFEKNHVRLPKKGDLAVVIGAGKSGLAVSRLLASHGVKVRLLEKNENAITTEINREAAKAGIELFTGDHSPAHFRDASFIIPSPAVPILKLRETIENGKAEILSEMEMAYRFLNNEPIIAVTGTSGKTTCASMAASMLKHNGYEVFLGGNIGTPLSEYVLASRKADALVLEISSFQLQGCKTFSPRVAILLNISPNHLDYHKDLKEYIDAKCRIFQCQDENDLAIIDSGLKPLLEKAPIKSRKIWLQPAGRFTEMQLFGHHNGLNAEAAWQAVRYFGVSEQIAAEAIRKFEPLPHRLEKIGEFDNILFINDSKSTTTASLKVALSAFERPIILLCGGKFKGGDLSALNHLIKEKVKNIFLFGASREIFENAWKDYAPIDWSASLEEAVQKAFSKSEAGDVVLLSPGTSSFDLFKNYRERGDKFKKSVERLICSSQK